MAGERAALNVGIEEIRERMCEGVVARLRLEKILCRRVVGEGTRAIAREHVRAASAECGTCHSSLRLEALLVRSLELT